jgi:cobalt-zinc-cadmium resistance protein CzcA
MRFWGVSANLMSLGAIDFGLIVDGAVVMMENFIRHRSEPNQHVVPGQNTDAPIPRLEFFITAATEVARPILFGVMIIIAVYLPIFTLQGLEGKMFRPMAITVCSAILGSLILSLTVIPVLSSFLLRLDRGEHEEHWFQWLRRRYLTLLTDTMNHRIRTVLTALVLVTLAIGSIPFLGTEFMPKLDEGSILIETRKLPSISLRFHRNFFTDRAHAPPFSRSETYRHENWATRCGDRSNGYLSGRCLRDSAPDRRMDHRS